MTRRSAKFHEAMAAYNNEDSERALLLMEECARDGDPIACFMTALWYRDGEGAPSNPEASSKWLSRLLEIAEEGNPEAQWELSQNLRFGNLFPLSIDDANGWLERAAEGGYGEAQHHLAWYYEHGLYGYSPDLREAAKWYQRAFDQEHPETLHLYAMRAFVDGKPTEEAIGLLRRAADKGFKHAAQTLQRYLT